MRRITGSGRRVRKTPEMPAIKTDLGHLGLGRFDKRQIAGVGVSIEVRNHARELNARTLLGIAPTGQGGQGERYEEGEAHWSLSRWTEF
jgi:hypothetical protein